MSRTDSLQRWGHRNRILRSTLPRKAWRHKSKQKRFATSEEKKANIATRRAARGELNAAIEEATDKVRLLAQELAERFPGRKARWFHERMMQMAKTSDTQRGVNRWNAYLYKAKKRVLDGK